MEDYGVGGLEAQFTMVLPPAASLLPWDGFLADGHPAFPL